MNSVDPPTSAGPTGTVTDNYDVYENPPLELDPYWFRDSMLFVVWTLEVYIVDVHLGAIAVRAMKSGTTQSPIDLSVYLFFSYLMSYRSLYG